METIDYKFTIAFSALNRILTGCGGVCEEFINDPTCNHPSCHSSYKAWRIALLALKDIEAVSNGDIEPLRIDYAFWGKWNRENPRSNEHSGEESKRDIPLSGSGQDSGPDIGDVPEL